MIRSLSMSALMISVVLMTAPADDQTPQKVLEDQGLKLRGEVWQLAEEFEAGRLCIKNKDDFEKLNFTYEQLNSVNNYLIMLRWAEQVRDGAAMQNEDLNIELDHVPRWSGLRVNGLNSVQRQMNDQLLNNRQEIANTKRYINDINNALRSLPKREKLQSDFDKLLPICQRSLVAAETSMNEISRKYEAISRDESVKKALNGTGKSIEPSSAFLQAKKYLSKERQILFPSRQRRR